MAVIEPVLGSVLESVINIGLRPPFLDLDAVNLTGQDTVFNATDFVGSGATLTDLNESLFGVFVGVEIASGGQNWHRLISDQFAGTAGETYKIAVLYRAGTTNTVRIHFNDLINGTNDTFTGTIGSIAADVVQGAMTYTNVTETNVYGNLYLFTCDATAIESSNYRVGLGSNATSGSIIGYGLNVT